MFAGPTRPDNKQVHRVWCGDHSQKDRTRVAVDGEPLDCTRAHSGVDSDLTRDILVWGDAARESSVLQKSHRVNHLQLRLKLCSEVGRPEKSGSRVA